MLVSGLRGERKGRGVDLALLEESMLVGVGGVGGVKLVPKRLAKVKGFFLIGGDFVRLTSGDWLTKKQNKTQKAGGADAVLLGDMVLVIAGVVAIFVLVVKVVVHVAIAVV